MNFKEARIYILEHVIDYLNKRSSFETSYRYGNVIKEYHDKLTFLKSVEKMTRIQRAGTFTTNCF